MREIPATLCAAAVVVAVLTAPPPATSREERALARDTNVYVQGDSLTVGTADSLDRRLDPKVRRLSIDAQVSRATAAGLARLRADRRADHARVWVIALGTNDSPNPTYLRRQIRRSLRLAGPDRQVVWLTIRRPGRYQPVNAMLRRFDRERKRLHVVDWSRTTRERPWLLAGDGVHATAPGYELRAHLIAAEANRLAQQP